MRKIYGFIPSRMGSERFPNKPLIKILDKPMVQHVYERAKRVSVLEEVYVATDHLKIKEVVESFGGKVILTKESHPSGTDRIQEATDLLGLSQEDLVINIQGDQPVFDPYSVELLAKTFDKREDLQMATLMYPIRDLSSITDPNVVKVVVDNSNFALYFSRAPIPFRRGGQTESDYQKHLGIYAYKKSFLDTFASLPQGRLERMERLEQLRALENGYKILVLESPSDSLEVDRPEDIEKIEAYLRNESP